MEGQQNQLLKSINEANQDLIYNRIDETTVGTVCACGKYSTVDRQPRFTCLQRDGYVMRESKRYKSAVCEGKKKPLHPVSNFLRGIPNKSPCMRGETPRDNEAVINKALQRQNNTGVVESWCAVCKEKSKFKSPRSNEEGNVYRDNRPR
jgi:hypothetical protein